MTFTRKQITFCETAIRANFDNDKTIQAILQFCETTGKYSNTFFSISPEYFYNILEDVIADIEIVLTENVFKTISALTERLVDEIKIEFRDLMQAEFDDLYNKKEF